MDEEKTLGYITYLRRNLFNDVVVVRPREKILKAEDCPFCEGNEKLTQPEITAIREHGTLPNEPGWHIRVVPNHNPIFGVVPELKQGYRGMLYDKISPRGCNEIVVESPHHEQTWLTMPNERVLDVLRVCAERIKDLKRDKQIRCLTFYKNFKRRADKIDHPYSTIIGMPVTPRTLKNKLNGARDYYEQKERCIFCDIIRDDISNGGERVVMETWNFLAEVPFAARFPFEITIFPKQHETFWEESRAAFSDEFSAFIKTILGKMEKVLSGDDDPPYMMFFHSINPDNRKDYWKTLDKDFHWHIEIVPRLEEKAAFTMATGFYINPVIPEDAAKILREA